MDIDSREFSVWLNGTVKYLPISCILHLDEMLLEQINGDDGTNDKVILKMKELLERYDKALKITEERINKKEGFPSKVPKMTQAILNNCLKYSTKCSSFHDMDYFITKFRDDYGITPKKQT
nr:ADM_HP1_G0022020.mRNA.1.CDS.1 [Saccharomyces cerevisiae]